MSYVRDSKWTSHRPGQTRNSDPEEFHTGIYMPHQRPLVGDVNALEMPPAVNTGRKGSESVEKLDERRRLAIEVLDLWNLWRSI